MKLEVSKLCSRAPLGSLGGQESHLNGGLPTPRMDLQQSYINSNLIRPSLSPVASNEEPILDSLIESVCLSELNSPEIDMSEDIKFSGQLLSVEANVMSHLNRQSTYVGEESIANWVPLSPAFYSGDFTEGVSVGEMINELDSFLSCPECPSPKAVNDSSFLNQTDNIGSGSRTSSRISSEELSIADESIEDTHKKALFESLYQDKPLLPIRDDILHLDDSFISPLNEFTDSTSGDMNISPDNLDSIYNISDFDLSNIHSSLDLFEDNVISQALQDIDVSQCEFGTDVNEVVNSFLNTDDQSLDISDTSSIPVDVTTPSDDSANYEENKPFDPILQAFMFTYGEEKKPRILKNVKILTQKSCSSSTVETHSSSVDCRPKVTPPTVVVKPKPLTSLIKKASSNLSKAPFNHRSTPRRNSPRNVKIHSSSDVSDNAIVNIPAKSSSNLHGNLAKKKRTKMSLQGLSDAEKYLRIRSQNNLASKKCRERKKEQLNKMRIECEFQEQRHDRLTEEYLSLQQRRDRWKRLFFHYNS